MIHDHNLSIAHPDDRRVDVIGGALQCKHRSRSTDRRSQNTFGIFDLLPKHLQYIIAIPLHRKIRLLPHHAFAGEHHERHQQSGNQAEYDDEDQKFDKCDATPVGGEHGWDGSRGNVREETDVTEVTDETEDF